MHAALCSWPQAAPASNGHGLDRGEPKPSLRRVHSSSGVSTSAVRINAVAETPRAAKAGGKWCATCAGKGAVECPGCKGSGKNKKNGNVFERWKCYDCQGFGLISCKKCGAGGRGLTPEQRGER